MMFYAIAELCTVSGRDASFEEENEDEPVVCVALGLFKDYDVAEKKAAKLNKKWEDERFTVVKMDVN